MKDEWSTDHSDAGECTFIVIPLRTAFVFNRIFDGKRPTKRAWRRLRGKARGR